MANIKLGVSPITGNVYAGRLDKSGTMWIGEKYDVTADFNKVMHDITIGKMISYRDFSSDKITNHLMNIPHERDRIEKAIEFLKEQLKTL